MVPFLSRLTLLLERDGGVVGARAWEWRHNLPYRPLTLLLSYYQVPREKLVGDKTVGSPSKTGGGVEGGGVLRTRELVRKSVHT